MISLPKPQKFTSKLVSIEKISSKVYLERFELVEPKEITFLAGQTVMLYIANGIHRSMSIASPPSEQTVLTFVHDVSPMGAYSKWALSAKAGDQMQFMGPLGAFVLDRGSRRKKIFVATGTGIAPFHSMTLDCISDSDIVLYWGLRHEEDIFWQKEFEELSSAHSNFRFVLTLSQPASTRGESTRGGPSSLWVGKRGHVQDHIFSSEQNIAGSDFYLCGSKEMVGDMRTRLTEAGVPQTQIKSEMFY